MDMHRYSKKQGLDEFQKEANIGLSIETRSEQYWQILLDILFADGRAESMRSKELFFLNLSNAY